MDLSRQHPDADLWLGEDEQKRVAVETSSTCMDAFEAYEGEAAVRLKVSTAQSAKARNLALGWRVAG
jgi:hypothetical protein